MLPFGVYDRLTVEPVARGGMVVRCDHPEVPCDARNLAWRAAERYFEAAGLNLEARIDIEKQIPVGAGLGGGSADAGAVLTGLNQLFENRVPGRTLHAVAQKLGADVPFFLTRRPALAGGIGEKLEPVEGLPDYPLVLIKPPVSVSTAWAYRSLKLTRGESRIRLRAFLAYPWEVRKVMENDLESATLPAYPVLQEMKDRLLELGALGALMSGSGPTVFGIFSETSQAERAAARMKNEWSECWVAASHVLGSPE